MIVAITDSETTGLIHGKDVAFEWGFILMDVYSKEILNEMSVIIKWPGVHLPKEIQKITNTTDELIQKYGKHPISAFNEISLFLSDSFERKPLPKYFIAHNAPFDKGFFDEITENKSGSFPFMEDFKNIPWIDTYNDIEFPENISTRKLTYLALEYGYFNKDAHRALSDCRALAHILKHIDFDEILKFKDMPEIKVIAKTKKPWEHPEEQEKIDILKKEFKFRWDGENKYWFKVMKEHIAHKTIKEIPVKVEIENIT